MSMSDAVTQGIRVHVESSYLPERSDPSEKQWVFIYQVRITNQGSERVQLMSRHWLITDANGVVEEVRGPGVVGHQPVLDPGESFEYTSGCPLRTPFGTMRGTYQMVGHNGRKFDIEIAPFALSEPHSLN